MQLCTSLTDSALNRGFMQKWGTNESTKSDQLNKRSGSALRYITMVDFASLATNVLILRLPLLPEPHLAVLDGTGLGSAQALIEMVFYPEYLYIVRLCCTHLGNWTKAF